MPNRRSLLAASATQAGVPSVPGTLWAWGANNSYKLGLGATTASRSSPAQVGSGTNWSSVMINSNNSSSAVKTDGTLWTWGSGTDGNHGFSYFGNYNSPVQIGTGTNWSTVWNGELCKFARKTNGTAWSWGRNLYGWLGIGDTANRSSPVQIGTGTNWVRVQGSGQAVFGIRSDNSLFAWGMNTYGKLGVGDTVSRSSPTQVGGSWLWARAGAYVGVGVKSNGTLWTWGRNYFGLFGDGTVNPSVQKSSPTQVGSDTNWASVTTSRWSILAVKTDGTLWGWGRNHSFQLGLGDPNPRSSPSQVGSGTNWASVVNSGTMTIAVKTDKTLWAWGANSTGCLGQGDTVLRSSPVQVGAISGWNTSPVFGTSGAGNYSSFWIQA